MRSSISALFIAESRCAVDQLVATRAVDVVAVDVDDDVVDIV